MYSLLFCQLINKVAHEIHKEFFMNIERPPSLPKSISIPFVISGSKGKLNYVYNLTKNRFFANSRLLSQVLWKKTLDSFFNRAHHSKIQIDN